MWPRAASATISAPRTTAARTGIAADPNRRGARVGITSGLLFDTTGQALTHHPHEEAHVTIPRLPPSHVFQRRPTSHQNENLRSGPHRKP